MTATALLRERHPNRPLGANVEFYTAVLLDAVGLPRTLFSPTFAIGRVAGWTAHVAEQLAHRGLERGGDLEAVVLRVDLDEDDVFHGGFSF